MQNIIIPMAGKGYRFIKAGYKTYKPFLKLSEKENIIQNICNSFPKNSKKYFIIDKNLNVNYQKILNEIPDSKIIKIKSHKLGPGYTLLSAREELQNLKKVFVCYSDIVWKWNKKKLKLKNNTIFCYKDYHPYTKDNNNYAFCKVNKKKLIQLKEKSSFTKNWINEPLSIGLFYYINAKKLFDSLNFLKELNIKTNNEYFPSEGFNYLKNTQIQYVDNFAHIGKPNYYEEFRNWKNFFEQEKKFKNDIIKVNLADNIIIPAAGKSKRFKKERIFIPKHLYIIGALKKRMINYLSEFLPDKKKIIIIRNKKYNYLINKKKFKIINLEKETKGQAETIYRSLKYVKEKQSLFINSCDVFSTFDINKFLKLKKNSDVIIFTSKKSFLNLPTNSYSWVEKKKDKGINIYVKKKPAKNLKILTGNFYFKNKRIFNDCFEKSNFKGDNELYIDKIVKSAIKLKYNVSVIEDREYINLGTPQLIKDSVFWKKYFV